MRKALHNRIERSIWGTIIGLPVIAWITVMVLSVAMHPGPIDTGDRLLDKYLEATVDYRNYVVNIYGHSYLGSRTGTLPDGQFTAWEEEFGTRPEFWIMRYFKSYDETDSRLLNFCHLSEAEKLGSTNQVTCYLDKDVYYQKLDRETDSRNQSAVSVRPKYEYWETYKTTISLLNPDEFETLTSRINAELSTGQDYALAYYDRAKLHAALGEYDLAHEDIVLAVDADNHSQDIKYPYSGVDAQTRLHIDPDDPCIESAYASLCWNWRTSSLDGLTMEMADYLIAAGRPADVNTLHKLILLIIDESDPTNNDWDQGIQLMLDLKSRVLTHYPTLTAEQQAAVNELHIKLGNLQHQISQQRGSYYSSFFQQPTDLELYVMIADLALSLGSSNMLYMAESEIRMAKEEASQLEKLRPDLRDLARFDYGTLTWRDEPLIQFKSPAP